VKAPALLVLLPLLATSAAAQAPARRPAAAPRPAAPPELRTLQENARRLLAANREQDAAEELRRAAALGALDRDLALRLAAIEQAAGHPALAERQLVSVIQRFPSVQALLQLSRIQSGRRDTEAALDTLDRALALAPNSEDVLFASAQLSLATRVPWRAIRALEPLVRMCPTVADYPYLLGVALIQAEDMVAAVTPLEEAARLEPRRVLTLVALGLALNGSKRHADAKAQLVSALELEPDNVEGVAALAEAEEGLGEDQAAEAHALRALERSPGHITANMVLGMVRLKQERYAEAREPLERAAGAEFTSAKAHYQLSLAYARLGDTAGARRQIEIYQQKQKETEDRLRRLRLGPAAGGTRP
jgi:tetratricopeptide (TPR) repeat protein